MRTSRHSPAVCRFLLTLALTIPSLTPAETRRPYAAAEITQPWFPGEQVRLLEPESTRLATQLVRFAVQKYNAGVLKGEAAAISAARRWLAVAAHLQPANDALLHVSSRWKAGATPDQTQPEETAASFAAFLLSCTTRLDVAAAASPDHSAPAALAACLTEIAADLCPASEDAVYRAEVQLRDGPVPPWEALVSGAPPAP